jgi:hypothetical protein
LTEYATRVFIHCVLYTVYLQNKIPAICPLSLSVLVVHTGDVSKITVTPLAVQNALQFVPEYVFTSKSFTTRAYDVCALRYTGREINVFRLSPRIPDILPFNADITFSASFNISKE